jgi:hypothetical protein
MSWVGTIAFLLGIYYLYMVFKSMSQLMNPLQGANLSASDMRQTIDPLWEKGSKLDLWGFLSTSAMFTAMNLSDISQSPDFHLVLEKKNLIFNESSASLSAVNDLEIDLNITSSSLRSRDLWKKLQSNSTSVYLHILLVHHSRRRNAVVSKDDYASGLALHNRIQMIKYDKIPRSYRHRFLLSDFGWVSVDPEDQAKARMNPNDLISYWKPEVAVRLVSDWTAWPQKYLPDQISTLLVRGGSGKKSPVARYKPPVHADEIGLTSDKYVPLNKSVRALPLRLSYSGMSLQRWLLMQHLEESLTMQKEVLNFSDKDMDDVRRLISDTPLSLLLVTIVASLLHLIFELLSFQSDIEFWRNNKSLAGLSVRAVCTDLFSQVVVFLFLVDSDTSLLVTIPSFIAILIQIWKVSMATGLKFSWGRIAGFPIIPSFEFSRLRLHRRSGLAAQESTLGTDSSTAASSEGLREKEQLLERITLEADRFATTHLSSVLLPLALGVILRSLIYDKHASWYSFFISSLTGSVYAFGFVLMLPQLFINHRLRSVSYLPWKFLCYKFINTFIDDLFAFIIKMPTMHRLSVFRDDIVFIIYLWQRWNFRIDQDRPSEK